MSHYLSLFVSGAYQFRSFVFYSLDTVHQHLNTVVRVVVVVVTMMLLAMSPVNTFYEFDIAAAAAVSWRCSRHQSQCLFWPFAATIAATTITTTITTTTKT